MRLPPTLVPKQDPLSYFGALDAYHSDGELAPFKEFVMMETLKRWNSDDLAKRSESDSPISNMNRSVTDYLS